jgi:hypothetical protein
MERTIQASRLRGIIDLPEAVGAQNVTVIVCYETPERTIPAQTELQKRDALAADVWARITEINAQYPKVSHTMVLERAKAGLAEIERKSAEYRIKRERDELSIDDCLEIDRLALASHYTEKFLSQDKDDDDE